ncbi:ZIP family metal transporter [Candidatus Woesearchaeota archaeon]|nr:ZIP family metal transporter [Candidatus Woesearchaeota archaeon]
MAYEFGLVLAGVLAVSLLSFVGVFTLGIRQSLLNNILFGVVAFAAGTLISAAFFDLIPEALEAAGEAGVSDVPVTVFIIIGILVFYSIERFVSWHHHHHRELKGEGHKEVHAFTYLSLIGDAVHNFLDGTIIAASFLTNVPLGIATTIAIALHEIPQEISDFGLLIYGGLTKGKALLFNFVSALFAVIGGILGFVFLNQLGHLTIFLLAFAAGGFIYIASADLIPELHKEAGVMRSITQFILMIAGIVLIYGIISVFGG